MSIESCKNPTIKPTKINPATNIEDPATSIDECIETSLVKKRTPIANPRAERIASISPKVIIIDEDRYVITSVFDTLVKNITSITCYSHKESY